MDFRAQKFSNLESFRTIGISMNAENMKYFNRRVEWDHGVGSGQGPGLMALSLDPPNFIVLAKGDNCCNYLKL